MDLLEKVLNCKDEELEKIIEEEINNKNNEANKIEQIGFTSDSFSYHKGFIPLKTRIKYSNFAIETYKMETTDFIYDFSKFLRKYQINNKGILVKCLEYFINDYFGYPSGESRESIFNDIAWKTTTTDEEYFAALENNKIGDLKGKGAALCTEKSAFAQQILSIYGIESYYCFGCVDFKDIQEGHAFNIIKVKNGYMLVDYSIPTKNYKNGEFIGYSPFIGKLSVEEFEDFINNKTVKSFDDYNFFDNKLEVTNKKRSYVVGKYKILKEEKSFSK